MSDMIKKQRFGVEIEMTGLSRANAAEVVARELNSRVYDHIGSYDARLIKDSQGRTWKIALVEKYSTFNSKYFQLTQL